MGLYFAYKNLPCFFQHVALYCPLLLSLQLHLPHDPLSAWVTLAPASQILLHREGKTLGEGAGREPGAFLSPVGAAYFHNGLFNSVRTERPLPAYQEQGGGTLPSTTCPRSHMSPRRWHGPEGTSHLL